MRSTPTNTIRSKVETYLRERRQAGFRLTISGSQLRNFARFAQRRRHQGPITVGLALAWAQASRRPSTHTAAARLEQLQPFAKFWNQRDPENQALPEGFFGPSYRHHLIPHIYTSQEIRDLIDAASRWRTGGLRASTYATVFGLLAATGLRLSEALKLRCEDVDLEQGILTIRQTKFLKSRHVLLHPSTTRALKGYAKRRAREPASARAKHFFAIDGRPLSANTIKCVFRTLRRRLGWRCRGDRPAPRIHDLRFTFICRRVERWYAAGSDVNHLMLSLSTYVGHALPSSTYWYLTATPRLMALAARRSSGPSEIRVSGARL